jgi:membrane protein
MTALHHHDHDDFARERQRQEHQRQAEQKAAAARQPGIVGGAKEVVNEFIEDDVMTQSAAIAFYSGLAVAPLLTVMVWIARSVFGTGAKEKIVTGFEQVIGLEAAAPIRQLLDPASEQAAAGLTWAGLISIGILTFSATSVFAQLQVALNRMWDVKAKPGSSIKGFISKRLLSLGMLLSVFFLLMVSLVISAAVQAMVGVIGADEGWMWSVINNAVSLAIFTLLFAGLYKFIPDAKIGWRAMWAGAIISAILFAIGKFALAWYLGRGGYQSSYGAAIGSFVALLVWVYYSSIIVLIGAEVTEVYARRRGHPVAPEEHAVRVVREEREDIDQGTKPPEAPKPRA